MDNKSRQDEHKKNDALENIFPELEQILGTAENNLLDRFTAPKQKMVLIVGCARSGSTLLYQYLANSNFFFFPTNFLSRFYYAPYIGYRIQQALIDFDLKGEIFPKPEKEDSFKSVLGKTKGPKQPHEFWYFWSRFFKFKDDQKLSESEIEDVDWSLFLKELHALEKLSGKPILMKAMNLNWNLLDLKSKLPNVHFVFIKRDIVYNAQSLLVARKKFFGDYKKWYSFKPPNYNDLITLTPEAQVVEQVLATNLAIENQLNQLDESDYSMIDYETFCENPSALITSLQQKDIHVQTNNSEPFVNGNSQKVSDDMFNTILKYSQNKQG